MTKRSPSIRRSGPQGKNAPRLCPTCLNVMAWNAVAERWECAKHGKPTKP